MKKFLLLALLAPVFLASSCSDDAPVNHDGKGSIRLNAALNLVTQTRAVENPALTDLTVILTGSGAPQELAWPTDGLIENLEIGSYTVKLTTSTAGMPGSGFGNDFWEGEAFVTVVPDDTVDAEVRMSLLNGGVCFGYGDEFADVNIVPTVTDAGNTTITYADKTEDVAYFAPGNDVVVKVSIGGVPAKINGNESETLAITANKVWKMTFNSSTGVGGINIDVTFDSVDLGELDWTLDSDQGGVEEVLFDFDASTVASLAELQTILASCENIDEDGDNNKWEAKDFMTWGLALVSYSYANTELTPNNYLIFPGQAIGTAGKIKFTVATLNDMYYAESFKIVISDSPITVDNCDSAESLLRYNFTSKMTYTDEIDIPAAYDGKTIYAGICHDSSDNDHIRLSKFEISHTTN